MQNAILSWGSAFSTALSKVNILQNRIIRLLIIHGNLKDLELNNNELYANIQVLKFPDVYRLETAKFMHKCVNGTLPLPFHSYFSKKNTNHELRSHITNPFIYQLAHTDSYDRWLTNNGIRVWNEINNDMKKLPFAPFKSELKKEILLSYQNIQTSRS